MRVSDDRYTRDRQKFDLALRLIRHEARTFTIRQWTGLSDDRIRKLYRSYVMNNDAREVTRHRGKSPRQAAFFFRNPELSFQAAQLASLFLMYGLVGPSERGVEPRYRVGSLESGALLCRAYEAYLEMHQPVRISFEHAWFLLLAVARISGETAPLLFTALNNQFWSSNLMAPMANLPVVIFQFALSPYPNWQQLAWSGALIITVSILILSIAARVAVSSFAKGRR